MRLSAFQTLAFPLVLFSSGCARDYVARGADLYAGGHYIEAAEIFERTEKRLGDASAEERARYGLYRGITFQALGDFRSAERWLAFSESTLRNERAELSAEEQNLLGYSLRELARRAPAPRSAGEPAVATSRR